MLQNWSDNFPRELDQLQTWKDHSTHKIAHTPDTTTSSGGLPNQAQVQWFSRRTHRTHRKPLNSCVWLLQGKTRLEPDKKKSTEGTDQEKPQGLSPKVCFSCGVMDTLLSRTWLRQCAWGPANQGSFPEHWCSESLFRLHYPGMVHCPHGQPQSPAPPGMELCDPNPYHHIIGLSGVVSLHPKHYLARSPPQILCGKARHHPNHIIRLPGMTRDPQADRGTPPGITLQGFRYYLPEAKSKSRPLLGQNYYLPKAKGKVQTPPWTNLKSLL